MPGQSSPALGKGLGVAVGASGGDLGAAGDRVPSRLGPFDPAVIRHRSEPTSSSERRFPCTGRTYVRRPCGQNDTGKRMLRLPPTDPPAADRLDDRLPPRGPPAPNERD